MLGEEDGTGGYLPNHTNGGIWIFPGQCACDVHRSVVRDDVRGLCAVEPVRLAMASVYPSAVDALVARDCYARRRLELFQSRKQKTLE